MNRSQLIDHEAAIAFAREHASDIVELGGSRTLDLDDPGVVWVLVDGEALVFATDLDQGLPTARPRHLVATLARGSVAAAVDGTAVGRRWLLVSPAVCAVAVVPVDVLESDGAADLRTLVNRWMTDAGVVDHPPTGTTGPAASPPAGADAGAPPTDRGTTGIRARLDVTRAELARLELERLDAEMAAEAALVDASDQAVARASDKALVQLGSVLEREYVRPLPAGGADELLAVCTAVGRSIGVTVQPAHPEDLERATAIDAIAQASKLRSRPVGLADGWWREPGESLVGFREDGRPVALLARTRGGYDLLDPASGDRTPVDAQVAATLRGDGVELIRPIPDGPFSIRAMIRFGGWGTGRDVSRLVALAFVIGLVALIPPVATSIVFGAIVPQRQTERLAALTAAMIGLAFGSFFLNLGRGVALIRARTRVDRSLQFAVWDRLLRLPVPFFGRYRVGDLTERSMAIDGIRDTVTEAVIVTFLAGIFGLFNLFVMIAIDARLAAVGLLVTVVGAVVLFLISRAFRGPLTEVLRDKRDTTSNIHELLNGIVKVRTTGSERRVFARWAERYADNTRRAYETYRIDDLRVVFEGSFPTAVVLVLFVTVVVLGRAAVPAAAFMGFYVALGQLQNAVVGIARATVFLLQARPVLEQARPIFEERAEADATRDHPGRMRGSFQLRQVTFGYAGTTRPIFEGLSLTVEPGEFVAVVGPSGSGKSTLLRLLLGFERPDEGTVSIDGVDISNLDMEAVRRQMGVVLQQTALLPGSVFENIAGSVPLTLDEAWDAARRAGFDADVEALPDGIDTNIGDGVGILSGGQRQRLQIARALAGRPRVLLLDEATSALDNLTQSVVTKTVEELDVTRVVIAHRLSTIASADRVVVIAGGRVVQDGPFNELVHAPGPFADLIARQRL